MVQHFYGLTNFIFIREKNGRFVLATCPPQVVDWIKTKFLLFVIFATVLWIQLIQGAYRFPLVIIIESLIYYAFSVIFVLIRWTYIAQQAGTVELFRLVFQFERRHRFGKFKTNRIKNWPQNFTQFGMHFSGHKTLRLGKVEKKLLQLFQCIGFGTNWVTVSAYMFQQWVTPCWPSTLGNFLFPECTDGTISSWSTCSTLILLVMLVISYWVLLDIAGSYLIAVGELFFMPSYALKYYLRYFSVVIIAELITLSERINSNNQEILEVLQDNLEVYRELQILSKLYNTIQKDTSIISILWSVIFGVIVSLYCFISFGSNISLPECPKFGVVLVDAVAIIVIVFGTFAKVNQKSHDVLGTIKEKVIPNFGNKKAGRWLCKFLRSLHPLKVRLGDVNFVDNMTPLTFLDFSLGILVNLLLI